MLDVEEIEIPVPWGHIAGKKWNSNSNLKGIALHGIQDNAGAFDRLIPLLSPAINWIAIDFPSHGKSTYFSEGLPLHFIDNVYAVKRVADYLKWDKFFLLGHSLGAQVSVFFSAIFPENVIKTVLIDGLSPLAVNDSDSISNLRINYNKLHKLETSLLNKTAPSHTYEEALSRSIKNRPSKLTKESAETLIKRSLKPSGNGFMFSTDQRLKLFFRPLYSLNQLLNIIGSIKCPTLLIIAVESYDSLRTETNKSTRHNNMITLASKIPNFQSEFVEGNHDIHLNNAPDVAALINDFLRIKSSL